MVYLASTACVLSILLATGWSAPLDAQSSGGLQLGGGGGTSTAGGSGLTDILSQIDLPALLRSVNSVVKLVGVFCPPLSQVLDNVIQNVTSTAFRVFGRVLLRNGGLGGGGGGDSSGNGGQVSVVLPTFPPDDDEDYDEDEDEEVIENQGSSTNTSTTASTTTTTSTTEKVKSSSPELFTSPVNEAENAIGKRYVRAADQAVAESAPQPEAVNVEADDADRDKRFLPFGGGHASGGGSGNFLFDIIRNTADRAARTVGTVYRMVAGTENLDLPATPETLPQQEQVLPSAAASIASVVPSSAATLAATAAAASAAAPTAAAAPQLVAGSGATEEGDEKANGPGGVAEVDISKNADGYTEGIPGPITRLFVIANRGIANLVQDLILRLAQTSERLVNFKARLVTSLI